MTNFAFLQSDWPALHEAAARAKSLIQTDARASCPTHRHPNVDAESQSGLRTTHTSPGH